MKNRGQSYIEHFGEEVHLYLDLLSEAFDGVIAEGVSKYPVFIFHQQDVNLGLPIADRMTTAGNWSVNVSTLEEFYIKGVVTIEKVEDIKAKITGTPQQYCCLVLFPEKGTMIFFPRVNE